jgi:16S rRNA (guanine527-N7)-methyltransferase
LTTEKTFPEPVPENAKAVFGEALPLAQKYVDLLVRDGDLLGLVGPKELPKIWSRHILNSAVVADLLEAGSRVADVGSGAGLPGIPMAIKMPTSSFTLIEPMERRAKWLAEVVVPTLGLNNVQVLRMRAQDAPKGEFDVVTARAVAALPKLIQMLAPLCHKGGTILALKGSKAAEEIEDSKPLVKKFGLNSFEIVTVGQNILTEPTTVVKIGLL